MKLAGPWGTVPSLWDCRVGSFCSGEGSIWCQVNSSGRPLPERWSSASMRHVPVWLSPNWTFVTGALIFTSALVPALPCPAHNFILPLPSHLPRTLFSSRRWPVRAMSARSFRLQPRLSRKWPGPAPTPVRALLFVTLATCGLGGRAGV